jgi:hypothetical protein
VDLDGLFDSSQIASNLLVDFVSIVSLAAYGGITSGLERDSPNDLLFGGFMLLGLIEFAKALK